MLLRSVLTAALTVAAAALAGADDKNPLAEPKAALEYQLKLLKAGDADRLKECFTKRQQDGVTKEAVAAGQKRAEKLTLDDLVKEVAVSEKGGVKTAKVTMKNGRTLTTLVLTDGKWLADTVWFK